MCPSWWEGNKKQKSVKRAGHTDAHGPVGSTSIRGPAIARSKNEAELNDVTLVGLVGWKMVVVRAHAFHIHRVGSSASYDFQRLSVFTHCADEAIFTGHRWAWLYLGRAGYDALIQYSRTITCGSIQLRSDP